MASTWYKRKWVVVSLHIAVWMLIFILPLLLQQSIRNAQHSVPKGDKYWFVYLSVFTNLMWVALFYTNALLLIPRLIYRRKYILYALTLFFMLLLMLLMHWVFFTFIVSGHPFSLSGFFFFNTFPFIFFLACSTAYRMIQDRVAAEQLLKEKETENLKTELSFLRSQVNPHFMFNVLNNMVALARKKSDKLEPSLIQLSSLLRYMLYETDEDKVPLEREIEYLQSYIDLQQQRFGKKLLVNVAIAAADNSYDIEPMLLIPFVENAFKHGTGMIEDPQIDIELRAANHLLQLTVKNKYNTDIVEVKDKTSGIGLSNVKRRLKLLYGANHTLLVSDNDGLFVTSLQIKLH